MVYPNKRLGNIARLLQHISKRRKVQSIGVALFTLVGAAAELIGIGAILPFLQLVAAPQTLTHSAVARVFLAWTGGHRIGDLVLPAAILLICASVASAAIRLALVHVSFRYVYAITRDLAVKLFSRIIHQPYGVFIRHNSSEALSGLDKINYVGGYLISSIFQGFSSLVIAIAIIVLLVVINPVAAILGGGSVAAFYVAITLRTRAGSLWRGQVLSKLATARTQLSQETFGGLRDIILDNSYREFEHRFDAISTKMYDLARRNAFMSLAPRYCIEAAGTVLLALLTLYFSRQPGGVVGALPTLGALALSAQRLMPLLQNINTAYVQSISMQGMLEDVLDLLDRPSIAAPQRREVPKEARLSRTIELRDLAFSYGDGTPALRDVNLSIPKGSRIGFVGRTGSGKTTILDVVMGLLEPTGGALLVDGVPMSRARMGDWQAQIAHVPQSIFLVDGSIAANIAFGVPAPDIDHDRVADAARRADIADFIESLPDGYATSAGERGVRLSGGQRQRIGIARALYKQATVLIFDEATSALDSATEAAVMANIEALERDLTILMIAHRVSTVAMCDQIVRLEAGRVVEVGSYADVVQANVEVEG